MKRLSTVLLAFMTALGASGATLPQPTEHSYVAPGGYTNVYLVLAPTNPPAEAAVTIYMHGANHDEKQGMTLFPILRRELARRGWIYVSPRYYEYQGLRKELTGRYGQRKIYLAGASAGARVTYAEVCKNPKDYCGQFLIGPALHMEKPQKGLVTIPTFIIYGDQDYGNTQSASLVASELKRQKVPVLEIVIKGDGHEAPYGKQNWWYEALPFVTHIEAEKQ